MTNKDVIQLFAMYEPILIAEIFDDCYCMGKNDGCYEERTGEECDNLQNIYSNDWLDSDYDKDLFREQDVERLVKIHDRL